MNTKINQPKVEMQEKKISPKNDKKMRERERAFLCVKAIDRKSTRLNSSHSSPSRMPSSA